MQYPDQPTRQYPDEPSRAHDNLQLIALLRKAVAPLLGDMAKLGDPSLVMTKLERLDQQLQAARPDNTGIEKRLDGVTAAVQGIKPTTIDLTKMESELAGLRKAYDKTGEQNEVIHKLMTKVAFDIARAKLEKATNPKDPTDYLNVRLSDGQDFYKPLTEISTAVSRGGTSSFADAQGNVTRVKLNTDGTVPVAATFTGTVTSSESPANDSFGSTTALTNGSTATLVNIASSVAGYRVKGFVVNGTGDGYWFIQIAGTTVLSGRTRWSQPTLDISLPNGIPVSTGSTVTLQVTNESGSTANYEGTLIAV